MIEPVTTTNAPKAEFEAMQLKTRRRFVLGRFQKSLPALFWLIIVLLLPLVYTVSPVETELTRITLPPGSAGPLGTDDLGRDVLARLLEGARVSLGAGFAGGAAALLLGSALGMLSGLFGGWLDWLILRLLEAFIAMPALLIALLLAGVLGAGATTLIISAALLGWMPVARVTREETRRLLGAGWVGAATALGTPRYRIAWQHILPHLLPIAAVLAIVEFRQAVILEATLSYLGAGIQPPAASWGNMLSGAQLYLLSAPHLALAPGLALTVTLLVLETASRNLTKARP
jgi:peptide/nickel transport system permease protein